MAVTILAISGLILPKFAVACACILVIARLIFTVMYAKSGANSRLIGAVGGSLPLYILALSSFGEIIRMMVIA